MDWTAQVDNYCERLEPGFWAEPINAVTNLAFMIAAIWVWPKVRGDRGAELLCLSLFLIGVGSGLFHTLANEWTQMADSLSILIYILIYVYLATDRILLRPKWQAAASVVLFFPYAIASGWVMFQIFGSLNGSTGYFPVILLIFIYAMVAPSQQAKRGLLIGVGLLAVSLFFRTIDESVCPSLSIGTHFLWHTLNGIMLGWMILVIHMVAHTRNVAR